MPQIFPKEIIENTTEVHQFKHSNKSKIIYGIILLAIIAFLVALPFINVTIYNTSQGLIRPDKERVQLQSSANGKVIFNTIEDNLQVQKGDTLLMLNNLAISQQLNTNKNLLEENDNFISDLKILTTKRNVANKLESLRYQQEYSAYQQRVKELNTRFIKIKRDHKRNTTLFNKGVIPAMDLQNSQLEYDLAQNNIQQYKKQQLSNWQAQLVTAQNRTKELKNNSAQLKESNNLNVITAPITGTLLNAKGLEKDVFFAKRNATGRNIAQ